MSEENEEVRFLTTGQIAKRLGIANRTVADLMARWGVTRYEFSHRVVRYDAADFDAAIGRAAIRK